jgi:hypothetical protein
LIRFVVTNGVKRAATWVCWAPTSKGKSDVYLACRELGHAWHVSLHQSGDWHVAYIQKFFEENLRPFSDSGKSDKRFITEWPRPPEIAEGVTLAFRIITPNSAVSTPLDTSLSKKIISIPVPPDNHAVEIAVIITASYASVSHWPGRNSMDMQLVGSMSLDSGETVWIVHRVTDIPALGTLRGKRSYFGGKNEDDIARAKNPRVLAIGHTEDGSRFILDSAVKRRDSPT